MIPIEKNIAVVDEQGNVYEATYLKRAKGLVKNGRARFVNENTICLACPPNISLEDITMSDNKEVISNTPEKSALTINYLLGKIEEISSDQSLAMAAITELGNMKSGGPGDLGMGEQARAVGEIVKARETTNQRLIALYEKMYDDLSAKQTSVQEIALRAMEKASDNEDQCRVLSEVLEIIRHLG